MEDPITKKKIKNRGQLPQYYIEDCHEAILDRETWAKVLAETERRRASANLTYPFTGKIQCGLCGRFYMRRSFFVRGRGFASWFCRAKKEKGITCKARNYSKKQLCRVSAYMMCMEEFDREAFASQVKKSWCWKTEAWNTILGKG